MIRILIVEDEITIARLIDLNLSACGYECTCEYDGLAAADLLEQMSFDLILLDIMLPGADGFELMDLIRPTKTPVIFLTARGSVSDRVNGLRAGADDYLVKPFDIVELIARVESVLRRTGKTGDRYTEEMCASTHEPCASHAAANRFCSRRRNLTCCSCLYRTETSRCSAKRSMSASGARNSRVTAARSTCMCSGCGESWAGRESS